MQPIWLVCVECPVLSCFDISYQLSGGWGCICLLIYRTPSAYCTYFNNFDNDTKIHCSFYSFTIHEQTLNFRIFYIPIFVYILLISRACYRDRELRAGFITTLPFVVIVVRIVSYCFNNNFLSVRQITLEFVDKYRLSTLSMLIGACLLNTLMTGDTTPTQFRVLMFCS